MKKNIKVFLPGIFCLINITNAFAQEGQVKITGSVTQRKNYEITVLGKSTDKSSRSVQYVLDTTSNKFAMLVPFSASLTYEMRIVVKKMGHRRLENDYNATFPLKLATNQNLNLLINPALFKEPKKGLTIEKQPAKFTTVSVSGSLKGTGLAMDLTFGKAVEGQLQTVETYRTVKGDSSFNFLVPIEKEGFYYLSTVRAKKWLFLKPNDQIKLDLDLKSMTELSTSESTLENRLIAQWEQLKCPLMPFVAMGSKPDREAFSAIFKTMQPKIAEFIQQVKTPDAKFNALFKSAIQLDNNLFALNVLLKTSMEKRGPYLMQSKSFLNVPDYYRQFLQENKLKSANILQLAEGNAYANLYAKFSLSNLDEAQRKRLDDADVVKLMMKATANDTLKSFVLKSQLEELELNVSNYNEFRETFMPYEKYAKLPSVKRKYDALLNMFVADTAFIGKSAYDFTLPDVNGKMVSMKEFKGKVVLIDVWATWCGPCKAQMPFLKEVEEHFKGNDNVVFAGISLDAEKDRQKWQDMIKEKQLEGVQLLDDVGKSFGRKYRAVSIPRFFLIDKKGNWAEVRCPLPENKEKFIKYIDRELKRSL